MGVMKVLVVDGKSAERRAIVEALLELDGISIQGAVPDLSTTLRVLDEAAVDILVAGTEMIDGDGLQLIQEVQRHEVRPSIVVVGPSPTRDDWRRHLDAGADRFVEPDPGLGELRQVVAALALQLSSARSAVLERAIGRMASGVAHDLNNYLSIIGLVLQRIERDPADAQLWTEARTALAQAGRLTTSLLDLVHGTTHRDHGTVDFGGLVGATLMLLKHTIPSNITVTLEIEAGLPALRGVASELEQVVLNLVLNAAEAMPDGGELDVRVTASTHTLMLQIADTGVGMGTRLFEDDGRSTKADREGQGLGIVRSAVARHGGSIAMAAREPAGTMIRVKFPW